MANRGPRRLRLCVALACAALAALVSPVSPALASPDQTMIFDAPHELMDSDGGVRNRTLDELRALGVDEIRVLMYWRAVAPSASAATRPGPPFNAADPATYPAAAWDPYDSLIAEARARGMKVLLTTSGPIPRWASSSGDQHSHPMPGEYYKFMHAVGTRYSGTYREEIFGVPVGVPLPDVDVWSIWNEPNVPYFLGPQYRGGKPYAPRLYRRLYVNGRKALLDTGNGADPILIGETGPRGGSRSISPLAFLRGALCLSTSYRRDPSCARLEADGWATHPYTPTQSPLARPRNRDDVSIGSLDRLASALDKAARAGSLPAGLPIHITEFGVQSKPDPYFGVSLARQAEYRSLSEQIAYRDPRVRSFAQYLMRDDPPYQTGTKYGGFESGLRRSGGERKPVYDEFRTPLAVRRRGQRVSIWGLVRPAAGPTQVTIEVRDGGAARALKTVATGLDGYFSTGGAYRQGRRWRVVWTDSAAAVHPGPWTRAY